MRKHLDDQSREKLHFVVSITIAALLFASMSLVGMLVTGNVTPQRQNHRMVYIQPLLRH